MDTNFKVLYIVIFDENCQNFEHNPDIYVFPDTNTIFKIKGRYYLEITDNYYRAIKKRRHKDPLIINEIERIDSDNKIQFSYIKFENKLKVCLVCDYKCRPLSDLVKIILNEKSNKKEIELISSLTTIITCTSIMQMSYLYKIMDYGHKDINSPLSKLPDALLKKVVGYVTSPPELWDIDD
jgi:hypothetical protein